MEATGVPITARSITAVPVTGVQVGTTTGQSFSYTFDGTQYATMESPYTSVGDGSIYTVVDIKPDTATNMYNASEPISVFGYDGTTYSTDEVSGFKITDTAPIQNTTYMAGDATFHATLDTAIELTGDFEITFDVIRTDNTGTNNQTWLASNANSDDFIRPYDSSHGTEPDNLSLSGLAGNTVIDDVFVGVSQGQHIAFKLTRVGALITAYIDGVSTGSTSAGIGTCGIDTLMIAANRTTRAFNNNQGMQNLYIDDKVTDTQWLFPLNEGSGTTFTDSLAPPVELTDIFGAPFTTPTGWSVDGDEITVVSSAAFVQFKAGPAVEIGKEYTISFDVSGLAGGENCTVVCGGVPHDPITANGSYSSTETATNTNTFGITTLTTIPNMVLSNVTVTSAEGGGIVGTWTGSNWVTVGNNDRDFKMDEGTGDRFYDSIQGDYATITNHDDSSWSDPESVTFTAVSNTKDGLGDANSQKYYDFVAEGDYLYAARGVGGAVIFDISDITAPVKVGTADDGGESLRNVLVLNGYLYTCSREGFGTSTPVGGTLIKWDISDKTTPVIYNPGSGDEKYEHYHATDLWSGSRYSAMCTDGEYIYVAGQKRGVYKFDPDDIASGPVDELQTSADGVAPTPDDLETQGIEVLGNYLYVANYDHGVKVLDKRDMTEVAELPKLSTNNWTWECCAGAGAIYASFNHSGGGDMTGKGLGVIDASDPESLTSWHGNAYLYPSADEAGNTTGGDEPDSNIMKFGNYVYIAHGDKGVAVFDVSSPLEPIYLGVHENYISVESTFGVCTFSHGGKTYCVYGGGGGSDTRRIFIDEVTFS